MSDTSEIDCPECDGSGQYVGLNRVESCEECDGSGTVPEEKTPRMIRDLVRETWSDIIDDPDVGYDRVSEEMSKQLSEFLEE